MSVEKTREFVNNASIEELTARLKSYGIEFVEQSVDKSFGRQYYDFTDLLNEYQFSFGEGYSFGIIGQGVIPFKYSITDLIVDQKLKSFSELGAA